LPEPEFTNEREYVAPENSLQEALVAIWAEILGIEPGRISIDDDFFHLGGHSLKATIMAGKIRKEFMVDFSLAEIFRVPTIRSISALINVVTWDRDEEVGDDEDTNEVII